MKNNMSDYTTTRYTRSPRSILDKVTPDNFTDEPEFQCDVQVVKILLQMIQNKY